MDGRRACLKDLVERWADAWGRASQVRQVRGDTRVETKNTIYQFRDGVCVAVTRREGSSRVDPTLFIGMRLVGWLAGRDPAQGLTHTWTKGAYAVLWRPREAHEPHSSVALTSSTLSMRHAPRALERPKTPVTMTRVIPAQALAQRARVGSHASA
jgi:hypothetical protein